MPDKFAMRLGAIILAGGRSVRMGQPKELLPFDGDTMLGRACRQLRGCCEPVLVLAREAGQLLPPLPDGVHVRCDDGPGGGPLPGLAHGLRWLAAAHGFTADDAAVLTGCDLPFLDAAAVRWLADQLGDGDLVMPRTADGLQPLAAIYRLRTLALVEPWLAAGTGSPSRLAEVAPGARILTADRLAAFDPQLRFVRNVNTPADYQAALALISGTRRRLT